MASLQCQNCKYGIHYHNEPSGIEYVMIEVPDWIHITSAQFDPKNKEIDVKTGYPKLYRTDTIAEDFPNAVRKIWKCPKCGTMILFDKKGKVRTAYIPNEDNVSITREKEWTGICFDDYQWDKLTEAAFPDRQLPEKINEFYEIYISEDELVMKRGRSDKLTKYSRIM